MECNIDGLGVWLAENYCLINLPLPPQEGDKHSDLCKRAMKNTYPYLLGVNMRLVSPAGGGIQGGGIWLLNYCLIILPLPPQEGDMHSDLCKRAMKNTNPYLLGVNMRLVSSAGGGIQGGGIWLLEKLLLNKPLPAPSRRGQAQRPQPNKKFCNIPIKSYF